MQYACSRFESFVDITYILLNVDDMSICSSMKYLFIYKCIMVEQLATSEIIVSVTFGHTCEHDDNAAITDISLTIGN